MAKQESGQKTLTLSSTKKEMLDAYQQLQEQLKQKREAEMKPEQRIEEKKTREAVQSADALSTEGVSREIANLKGEVGATLVRLSDRLESEIRLIRFLRTFELSKVDMLRYPKVVKRLWKEIRACPQVYCTTGLGFGAINTSRRSMRAKR